MKKNIFEEALDMCDIEVKQKFEYVDEQLYDIADDIVYFAEELVKAEIDEKVAEEMRNNIELAQANCRRVYLQRKLEELNHRYDILENIFDELLIEILEYVE